jgi:penicillin-binding protein 2
MSFGALLQDEPQQRNLKSIVLIISLSFFFLLLIARMFYVQVVQGDLNTRLSKENAMRVKVKFPPRGRILDKNGVVLARNRPSYSICVLPYKLKKRAETISKLCQIRDTVNQPVFDSTELEQTIRKAALRRFDVTRLKEDVTLDLVSIIEEHSMEIPGIIVETESRREYTLGQSAFHVLGYMSEIPETEFDSLKEQGYQYGDLIGKSGLERQYETIVRGTCGHEYIEVNAYGKSLGPITTIPRVNPVPGNDLYLTIDSRLQRVADIAFNDTLKGAVIALDPRNGEVLLMLSSPSVDPNIFSMSTSLRSKNWSEVATDSNLPLNNRVIGGTYTPGSTFKLISALAGLETNKLTKDSYMPSPCRGGYRIGSRIAHCWNLSGHGSLNLIGALQQSCNIYFYQVGLRLGDVTINHYAEMLGLGVLTGIDLKGERTGWLSGEEAYNKRFARRNWKWTKGLVLDLAIGQTQIVTPIQLALMVGGLGNSKILYKPFLVKEERTLDGAVVKQYRPEVKSTLNLNENTIEAISMALESVIKAGGTGGRASVPGVPVGGKTGSAENPQGDLTHALFVACAPVKNPVIAIAVVVENAGHGGSIAAPIAGEILRYFFAETEEGRQVVEELNPNDTTITSRLQKMVKPVKELLTLQIQNENL